MAVFFLNVCTFNDCGIRFRTLSDLIFHIEDNHIDYSKRPDDIARQALPMSCVQRFISEDARKEHALINATAAASAPAELKRKLAAKQQSYSMSSSNRSNTPTISEMDDDDIGATDSEDSNESWTTEEFSSEFIMRYGSRHSGVGANGTPGSEKPFACPVPGCKKRYKNVNGIKYHSKNGHKKDGSRVRKAYKCHCGKSYKTSQGLKHHTLNAHHTIHENSLINAQPVASAPINSVNNGNGRPQRSGSPSQSLGSLSPSSNMSSSGSSCVSGNGNQNAGNNSMNVNGNANGVLQQFVGNGNVQQKQQQLYATIHQQQQQHLQLPTNVTGELRTENNGNRNNSSNNIKLQIVSIKAATANNSINISNNGSIVGINNNKSVLKTTAASIVSVGATPNKVLKLSTATAVNTLENVRTINQQQQQQQQQQQTTAKMSLPNLVNLGILTPTTSPPKSLQSLNLSQAQGQQLHQTLTQCGGSNRSNIIFIQEQPMASLVPMQQQQQQQQQHQHRQQQQQLQQRSVCLTLDNPISDNKSTSSSGSPTQKPKTPPISNGSTFLTPTESISSSSSSTSPSNEQQKYIANIMIATTTASDLGETTAIVGSLSADEKTAIHNDDVAMCDEQATIDMEKATDSQNIAASGIALASSSLET